MSRLLRQEEKEVAKSSTKDMTTGSPMRLILGFTVPLLFGFLFQQFYSVVDTIIVGKVLGVNALASLGATGSVNFMIIGFCMGVCNGFAIPVAHKFGARDYWYAAVCGKQRMAGGGFFTGDDNCRMSALQKHSDVDEDAGRYFRGCI